MKIEGYNQLVAQRDNSDHECTRRKVIAGWTMCDKSKVTLYWDQQWLWPRSMYTTNVAKEIFGPVLTNLCVSTKMHLWEKSTGRLSRNHGLRPKKKKKTEVPLTWKRLCLLRALCGRECYAKKPKKCSRQFLHQLISHRRGSWSAASPAGSRGFQERNWTKLDRWLKLATVGFLPRTIKETFCTCKGLQISVF